MLTSIHVVTCFVGDYIFVVQVHFVQVIIDYRMELDICSTPKAFKLSKCCSKPAAVRKTRIADSQLTNMWQ